MTEEPEPIAIIGVAGRFPGAMDVSQFWRNLVDGRVSIDFPSDEELAARGVPAGDLANPGYVKASALAPEVDRFDAGFFGFTPREAAESDPQIRLFLESCYAALEQAGHRPGETADVGVFGSVGTSRYGDGDDRRRSASGMSHGALTNADSAATMVSYKLGLHGPSMTVQTACSSSLVAVHLAAQALRAGECEMALAGGADVELPLGHGHHWDDGGPLSPDGNCRPFDAEARGTIFGTGGGAVVLKTLSAAQADNDTVLAVLHASAVNNDGAAKVGFAAPSVGAQAAVVTEAILVSGLDPGDIGFVEAHGTGTVLGDPIEVAALGEAFRRVGGAAARESCVLGSVKGNVGHLGHAAGVTSLIKAVLALHHEVIPPTVGFDRPNPRLELEKTPFHLPKEAVPWPRRDDRRRAVGVSSLGVGGTNVHVVLGEAPAVTPTVAPPAPRLIPWSARSEAAAETLRARLADYFSGCADDSFADAVATMQRGRASHLVRAAAVADRPIEATVLLTDPDGAALIRTRRPASGSVAFLFPGQGSQYVGAAFDLYEHDPAFAEVLDEVFRRFAEFGMPARAQWRDAAHENDLADTLHEQPVLFALEYALAQTWLRLGVRPAALLGHSIGELVAAAVAGVLSLPDACAVVAARARAMHEMPDGRMIAVAASAETVSALLPPGVVIAVDNGPRQVVVAGSAGDLDRLVTTLQGERINHRRMKTSRAFHSPDMAPAVPVFQQAVEAVRLSPPRIPVYSAASGRLLTDAEATDPAFWARQLVQPVLFGRALDALLSHEQRLMVEVGPGRTLTALARQHPVVAAGTHLATASLPQRRLPAGGDRRSMLTAAAMVWTDGHDIDWVALSGGAPFRRTAVPGYPFERERHWRDRPRPAAVPAAESARVPEDAQPDVAPFSLVHWVEAAPLGATPRDGADAVAFLPADRAAASRLLGWLHRAGLRVVPAQPGTKPYHRTTAGAFVRPGDPDDLRALLEGLDVRPELLVHAWSDDQVPEAERLAAGFHTVTEAVRQYGAVYGGETVPGLLVVTGAAIDVSGGEEMNPANAMLPVLARTLAAEQAVGSAKLVDLGDRIDEETAVAELAAWRRTETIALRGDRRWRGAERAFMPTAGHEPALRHSGGYLLTGGTGGLGIEVAMGLARTGTRPRLALLSRRGELAADDRTALELLGAMVDVVAGDVTDPAAVRRAIAALGVVNGVFHLAGVAGDGMVLLSNQEDARTTFAPKTDGTSVLARTLADGPTLDFFVGFSSRAVADGLVGGADYASANAFLDAVLHGGRLNARRSLSIAWPSWRRVGMATTSLRSDQLDRQRRQGARHWRTTLSAETNPVLDEHRMRGVPVLPGTAFLDLVVQAFRARVTGDDAGTVELADVVFQRPLEVPAPTGLTITLAPAGAGSWDFAVESEPSGVEPVLHVTGSVATAEPLDRRVDLAALVAQTPSVSGSVAATARLAFTLGPRWDTVQEVRRSSADPMLRVVAVALPEKYASEAAEHALHPSLLDTATAYARDLEREDPHAPFLYDRLVVQGRLPAQFVSIVRRRERTARDTIRADIDLVDARGMVLAEVTGFAMRRIMDETLAVDERRPLAPSEGIEPAQAVALLFDLLAARTPRHVLVRPFTTEGPVPLGDAVTAGEHGTLRDLVTAPAPEPAAAPPRPAATPASGEWTTVRRLAELWTQALGLPAVQLDDDFFEIGGNSLTAVELMSQVRATFGIKSSVATIFDHPTLGALAEELDRQMSR